MGRSEPAGVRDVDQHSAADRQLLLGDLAGKLDALAGGLGDIPAMDELFGDPEAHEGSSGRWADRA